MMGTIIGAWLMLAFFIWILLTPRYRRSREPMFVPALVLSAVVLGCMYLWRLITGP